MKQTIVIAFVLGMIFVGLDCKKEPPTNPQPPTNCDSPPGNRNFTWRTDTVAWWPSEVGGVWAFSDDDAWVVGNLHGPTVPGPDKLHTIALEWNRMERYNPIHGCFRNTK